MKPAVVTAILTVALALAVSTDAFAQERPLSLNDVIALTKRNNHDLSAARAALEEARSDEDRAFGALLPTISANGIYTHNYKNVTYANLFAQKDVPPAVAGNISALTSSLGNIVVLKGDALQASLGVNIPLASAPAWFGYEAARSSFHAAEANTAVTETTILYAAAQAFYAAAGTDELLEARQHGVEVARKTLDNSQALFNAGKATRLDLDRAELAIVNAQQALREAVDLRESSYRSLGTLAGFHDAFRVEPPAQPMDGQSASVAGLVEQSYRLRPEFAAYTASIKAAAEQSRAAHWQWAPTLSGFGNLNGYNYAGITGDYYSWAAGLQLSWTIYDGGVRDAARRQADARRVENEEYLEQLRLAVADDIANASRALATKGDGLVAAVRAATIASEALDLVRAQYTAGIATQLDVLQAQDSLINAEVQRAQARFDLALADLSLQRNSGTFPEQTRAE
jgi:outer membrane protein TolC